jgi:hypothetical protein
MTVKETLANLFESKPATNTINEYFPNQQGLHQFHKNIPNDLIRSNKLLLEQTATTLTLSKQNFDKTIMPLVTYLAKYCLQLPASQMYHHNQPGSLFYHLLETANLAAQNAKANPELMMHTPVAQRANYEMLYPLGAWIMGILHDIAKPMTDVSIVPYTKRNQPIEGRRWRPEKETLYEYLLSIKAAKYKVLYNKDRDYHQHDVYRVWFVTNLVSFFEHDKTLYDGLLHIIPSHAEKQHPLVKIVKQADRLSTHRDTTRFRPFPVFSNYAKLFIDVLQDFDMTRRIDDAIELPYCFSSKAMHIYYPLGLQTIMRAVKNRSASYSDIAIPTDPEAWVNLLGKEHHLLIANHQSKSYTSKRYPDITPYIYDIVVNIDNDEDEHHRVISLSLEHVLLYRDIASVAKKVSFTTHQPLIDDLSAPPVTAKNKGKKSKKPKTSLPASPLKAETLPAIDSPQLPLVDLPPSPPDDDYADVISALDAASVEDFVDEAYIQNKQSPTDSLPQNPVNKKPAKATNKRSKPEKPILPKQTEDTPKINAPVSRAVNPNGIDLSAINDLKIISNTPNKNAKPSKVNSSVTQSTPKFNIDEQSENGQSSTLKEALETATEISNVEQLEIQLSHEHPMWQIKHDPVLAEHPVIRGWIWILYENLKKFDIEALMVNKYRGCYQIEKSGFAIKVIHAKRIVTEHHLFSKDFNNKITTEMSSLLNEKSGDVYDRIFALQRPRERVLQHDLISLLHPSLAEEINKYMKK